jgi:porin
MLSTVSSNVPAPVFPMTSLGVSTKWFLSKKSTFLLAIFDGSPTDFDENPNNLNWSFDGDDGILAFTEYQFASQLSGLPGTYKAGLYMHQHFNKTDAANADSVYMNNNGFYVIADQVIWNSNFHKRSLSFFSQLGLSPKHVNINQYYVSAGLRYSGLFDVQGNDAIGFAFNRVGLRGPVQDETVLELTCRIPVMKFLFIQADIQYVVHPAGTGETIDNALVTILRFGVNF